MYVLVFFFKQKTSYEMRISDWSSDVCSSDLLFSLLGAAAAVIAIGATFSLTRAGGERRLARREQLVESDRATQLEAAVEERTAELAEANVALRSAMIDREKAEAQLRQRSEEHTCEHQ